MPKSVDGRSLYVRRFRDVLSLHLSDAGGDRASEAIKSMARRAATLTVELERLEAEFATSKDGATPNQLDLYQRLTNSLRRVLETIGLERQTRDITLTPDLRTYLASKTNGRRPALDHEASD